MSFNIEVAGGTSVRLPTAGKYCDRDIVITAPDTGGAPVEEKDVNFYDYDGELLYSYTVAEAQALTELPPAPTPKKDFLVFDEWNWTLPDIKAYNAPLQVGATYKTADGKTYAVVDIAEDSQKSVILRYNQSCSSVEIDWGDGTAMVTTTSTGNQARQHKYAETGTYTITIRASGPWKMGLGNSPNGFLGNASGGITTALRELYIGDGASFSEYSLSKAYGLELVTIPKTVTQTGASAFSWCASLRAIIFPSTFTQIGSYSFEYCLSIGVMSFSKKTTQMEYAAISNFDCRVLTLPPASTVTGGSMNRLRKIVIPEGMTNFNTLCANAHCLKEIILPSSITTISASAFLNCYSLGKIRFKPTTPPTVANANAFNGIPTTCIVEVPAGTLATYQAATNYASIAAQMVEVSE